MTSMTENIVIELDRQNSLLVQSDGIEAENKSSWINMISPIDLKVGDNISLQNSIINIRGANSESIEITGEQIKGSKFTDNFVLLQVGFYINNNYSNNVPLPFKYYEAKTKNDVWQKFITNPILLSSNNPAYGAAEPEGPFNYVYDSATGTNPPRCQKMSDLFNGNPRIRADNKKYAVIDPRYQGFMKNIDNTFTNYQPDLLTQDIFIKIKPGFMPPNALADEITLQLQKTFNISRENADRLFNPKAHILRTSSDAEEETARTFRNLKAFNGSSMVSIPANFILDDKYNVQHPIYSFLATDEPYVWKYGSRLLSLTNTYDLNTNDGDEGDLSFGTATGVTKDKQKIYYPVFLFNRLTQSNANPAVEANYEPYSPSQDNPVHNSVEDDSFLSISNFTSKPEYNKTYQSQVSQTQPYDIPQMLELVDNNLTLTTYHNGTYATAYNNPAPFINRLDSSEFNYSIILNTNWTFGLTTWATSNNISWLLKNQASSYKNNFVDIEVPATARGFHGHIQVNTTHATITNDDYVINSVHTRDNNVNTYATVADGTYNNVSGLLHNQSHIPTIEYEFTSQKYNGFGIYNALNPEIGEIKVYVSTDNGVTYTLKQTETNLTQQSYEPNTYTFFPLPQTTTLYNKIKFEFTKRIPAIGLGTTIQIGLITIIDSYQGVIGGIPYQNIYMSVQTNNNIHSVVNFSNGDLYASNPKLNTSHVGAWTFNHLTDKKISLSFTNYAAQNCQLIPNDTTKLISPFYNLLKTDNDFNLFNPSVNINTLKEFFFITDEYDTNNPGHLPHYNYPHKSSYTINGQTVNFNLTTSSGHDNRYASLLKNQIIPTNLKATNHNINIIKGWFDNCKIYNGKKKSKNEIYNDDEYYINCDIGRSFDDDQKNPGGDITKIPWYNLNINRTAQAPTYMVDKNTIGSKGGLSEGNPNDGCNYPRNKTRDPLTGKEKINDQRLKLRTKFIGDEDYYDDGNIGYPYSYVDEIYDFNKTYNKTNSNPDTEEDIDTLLKKIKDNNMGIFLYECKNSNLTFTVPYESITLIGFYNYQDETSQNFYRIQKYTYFGFSPSLLDHNYISPLNNDVSAISKDYNPTPSSDGSIPKDKETLFFSDRVNYINVGAINPTISFNNQLNKFQFSNLHTPNFFNVLTGTDTNTGQMVASLLEDSSNGASNSGGISNVYVEFQDEQYLEHYDITNLNNGINDSLSGIYIYDIYFQQDNIEDDKDIVSITDHNAIRASPSNYYGSLLFKMGFSYFDLMPLNLGEKLFNNRFKHLLYNNIRYPKEGIRPFTTNSDLNISSAVSNNLFDFTTANAGKPQLTLGYNNFIKSTFEATSTFMSASSIPLQITNAYFRVHTDLPLDLLKYNANGTNLPCIGIALRNYSSASYYYSYASNFSAQIVRDVTITKVKIEIRNPDGRLVNNLDEKSSIILKVERQIPIGNPTVDPQTLLLKDIDNQLKKDFNTESHDKVDAYDKIKSSVSNKIDVTSRNEYNVGVYAEDHTGLKTLRREQQLQRRIDRRSEVGDQPEQKEEEAISSIDKFTEEDKSLSVEDQLVIRERMIRTFILHQLYINILNSAPFEGSIEENVGQIAKSITRFIKGRLPQINKKVIEISREEDINKQRDLMKEIINEEIPFNVEGQRLERTGQERFKFNTKTQEENFYEFLDNLISKDLPAAQITDNIRGYLDRGFKSGRVRIQEIKRERPRATSTTSSSKRLPPVRQRLKDNFEDFMDSIYTDKKRLEAIREHEGDKLKEFKSMYYYTKDTENPRQQAANYGRLIRALTSSSIGPVNPKFRQEERDVQREREKT